MKKNVLVISTSLRNNSNSDALVDEFIRGAQESGNQVEKVSLRGKTINYCRGCFACLTTGRCAIRDDANAIVEKMLHADVLVFSSPIYYYEMCGQMKTLLDRANPLYSLDYQFRDVYFLSAAAENEEGGADLDLDGDINLDDDCADFEVDDVLDDIKLDDDDDIE